MPRLPDAMFEELDRRLAPIDEALRQRYPGDPGGRQPVHTVYVPADRIGPTLVDDWRTAALNALEDHGPLPFDDDIMDRVWAKLEREPIEDLRIDFEDGFGARADMEEDWAVTSGVVNLPVVAFVGLRCKSLEAGTRRRAVRTLDLFLESLVALGPLPEGFIITLPKVSAVAQVEAMAVLCGRFEQVYELPPGRLRF